jgi:hypothetical protein
MTVHNYFLFTGKSGSPPSSPEATERPSFEGGFATLQQVAVPGKPPSFSIMLPAKVEVHEHERLKLDCSVQGFPTPIGQFRFMVMLHPRACVYFLKSLWSLIFEPSGSPHYYEVAKCLV